MLIKPPVFEFTTDNLPIEYKVRAAFHQKLNKVNGLKTKKGGVNKHQNYNYAREGDFLETLQPILYEVGLTVLGTAKAIRTSITPTVTAKGESKLLYYAEVEYEIIITDIETGYQEKVLSYGAAAKYDDKAVFSAITGAVKYAYYKGFGLVTEDPESNNDSIQGAKSHGTPTNPFQQQSAPSNTVQFPTPNAYGTYS